jgi:hypothetical protein
MRLDGEQESGMPLYNNQTAQRSVHGNQTPQIGRLETPYLISGTLDTGYALRAATLRYALAPRFSARHCVAVLAGQGR